MTPIYEESAYREPLHMSSYGYWILPSGTVLSLLEGMKHGESVERYVKGTPDQSNLDGMIVYERSKDPDVKKSTLADLWACRHLGWIRIKISQYSDEFQVNWSAKTTERAKETVRMILDEHGILHEDIETDYGSVVGWTGLKGKMENPTYWRAAL